MKTTIQLNKNQERLLIVYSLYTNEKDFTLLQYTAACALIYHLTKAKLFEYNLDELLVYDYLNSRLYIWEAKTFMTDINKLRDQGLLTRARLKSHVSRDVNAHQCSALGKNYIDKQLKENQDFKAAYNEIKAALSCANGKIKEIVLEKDKPYLVCGSKKDPIDGFINHFDDSKSNTPDAYKYTPFFL